MHQPTLTMIVSRQVVLFSLVAYLNAMIAFGQASRNSIQRDIPGAIEKIKEYHATEPVPSRRTLHIVYWTPNDREPIKAYRERLSRVFFDIREFYRTEMIRLGLGNKTIPWRPNRTVC